MQKAKIDRLARKIIWKNKNPSKWPTITENIQDIPSGEISVFFNMGLTASPVDDVKIKRTQAQWIISLLRTLTKKCIFFTNSQ